MRATLTDAFFFDAAELAAVSARHREAYGRADPYPHAVLEGLIPADALAAVAAEVPGPDSVASRENDTETQLKREYRDEAHLGPHTRHLLNQLNSATFVQFLTDLTGIKGLVTDPYFSGGGVHQIEPGGFLKVHADFNRLNRLRLDRRLNVLIYLNEDWLDEYGGHLELWSRDMARCVKRVRPSFGTCVIFTTLRDAFHGHPDPLTCPSGRTRNSLALYYYSNGRPEEPQESSKPHSTLWIARPDEFISRRHALRQRVPLPLLRMRRRLQRGRAARQAQR